MNTRVLLLLAAALGLFSALGTPGCGPTCPGNEPNCGTNNGSSAAGATCQSTASCAPLKSLRSCMDGFCATAAVTNPFCKCYKHCYDLDVPTCLCVEFDEKSFCATQAATGVSYDCSAAIGAISTACVGVE